MPSRVNYEEAKFLVNRKVNVAFYKMKVDLKKFETRVEKDN